MELNDIKFSLLEFKAGYYWSKESHKMFWSDDIGPIVWESEDVPVKMKTMSIRELIKFTEAHPGDCKKHRNAVMRIIADRFALKKYVDIDKWNNIIYVDLDMNHSLKFSKCDKEKNELLYENIDYALQNICPNNYLYIEHSSSGIGIHCMFLFDCERTQENYDKYCQYIYEVFRYKIDDYIKDFSSIFTETDGHKVFDDVYKRPYQKLYITTKDYILHNCNGYCDDIEVEVAEKVIKQDISRGTFDIKYISQKKKYDTDYYDRLYIITALKKYLGDYDKCKEVWYKFCEELTLYRDYTVNKFRNMLDLNWDKIKSDTGHIEILKKYGFKIDDSNLHIHLNENEYINDVVDVILDFITNGLNMLISGTGSGKTEGWKQWWIKISEMMSMSFHKSVLIVEPMNSIIESKYDPDNFEIITGSKRIKIDGIPKCYITNYNHLIKKTHDDKYVVRDDIIDFFSQFELVIIDESHIMMKDIFRSEVLIPFMKTLNSINNTKVILQTASPLYEESVLNIRKTVTIHKKEKANVKVIYRQTDDNFNISNIICLLNYYVSNGKKTYIYWSNGSLQNMNFIKKIYPDSMIIYHKKDKGSEDMKYINEEHMLSDKSNVMISSIYFGVGNDLNDEIDDAAVIIIGNNVWQEDIQAKGRWRNAKNIEVCIISLPHEKNFIESTKNRPFDWNERYTFYKNQYSWIYNDSLIRDKSIIISNKKYQINKEEDIEYLAKMQIANEYSCQLCIKNKEFKRLGYDVRENISSEEKKLLALEERNKALTEARNMRSEIDGLEKSVKALPGIDKSKIDRLAKIFESGVPEEQEFDDKIGVCNEVQNLIQKNDTLEIAKALKEYLEGCGVKVIMTRSDDSYVSVKDRCDIANNNGADLFISIHRSSTDIPGNSENKENDDHGFEAWINSSRPEFDKVFAEKIMTRLQEVGRSETRGVRAGYPDDSSVNYPVNKLTVMPSVLLNMGYITNSIDNQLLDANLEAYAKAIGNAIISGATELGVTAENGSRLWDGQLLSNKKSTEDKPAETESKPDESSESEDSSQLDEDGDTQDGYGEYDDVDYNGDTQVESEPDIVYTDDGMGYYTDPMTTE